jgi:DNA-binding HxlR family transcriptional regulator
VNWQHFMRFLASIRGRWDLAILANLTEGSSRPTELLDAINEQACDGHRLTWKVMRDRLRHLEDAGYVTRREVKRFPRETHYRVTEFARRLVAELDTLDAWYTANAPAPPVNTGPPDGHSCTKCLYALESKIRTSSSRTSPPYSF